MLLLLSLLFTKTIITNNSNVCDTADQVCWAYTQEHFTTKDSMKVLDAVLGEVLQLKT